MTIDLVEMAAGVHDSELSGGVAARWHETSAVTIPAPDPLVVAVRAELTRVFTAVYERVLDAIGDNDDILQQCWAVRVAVFVGMLDIRRRQARICDRFLDSMVFRLGGDPAPAGGTPPASGLAAAGASAEALREAIAPDVVLSAFIDALASETRLCSLPQPALVQTLRSELQARLDAMCEACVEQVLAAHDRSGHRIDDELAWRAHDLHGAMP